MPSRRDSEVLRSISLESNVEQVNEGASYESYGCEGRNGDVDFAVFADCVHFLLNSTAFLLPTWTTVQWGPWEISALRSLITERLVTLPSLFTSTKSTPPCSTSRRASDFDVANPDSVKRSTIFTFSFSPRSYLILSSGRPWPCITSENCLAAASA